MKDSVGLVPKALHVISMVVIALTHFMGYGQELEQDFISDEEYKIINMFISSEKKNNKPIYKRTYFDKGWALFFTEPGLDIITSYTGIPTTISDDTLKQLLNKDVRIKIYSKILDSKPLLLDRSKLNMGAKLVGSYDKSMHMANSVTRISEPIIVGNIAVYKQLGYYSSTVRILKKTNGNWEIVYTFEECSILID